MGILADIPGGLNVIRFMGHMKADERLETELCGISLSSPIGFGCDFDLDQQATKALAQFGVGLIEVGPFALGNVPHAASSAPAQTTAERLDAATESIVLPSIRDLGKQPPSIHLLDAITPVKLFLRATIAENATAESIEQSVEQFSEICDALILDRKDLEHELAEAVVRAALKAEIPCGLAVTANNPNCDDDATNLPPWSIAQLSNNDRLFLLIDGSHTEADSIRLGRDCFSSTAETVARFRKQLPEPVPIVANGGVHEPQQALELMHLGADLVLLDSGIVFSGPGLAKRCNAAILHLRHREDEYKRPRRVATQSWFWTALLAVALIGGGIMAQIIAWTRVIMPYDEAITGLTPTEITDINSNLLLFMRHDRVTLAGTMLCDGIIYGILSWFGVRRGLHWAHIAIVVSSLLGFFSFFLFLGFGYFDPFHAFVTAVLVQFIFLSLQAPIRPNQSIEAPDLLNDWRWKLSQWGQTLFLIHGAILIVAGAVISSYGVSTVFVPEDLEFMQTTACELWEADPQLVPLIAHDRASFGGMLISCGAVVFLSALWGFNRGQSWLWWAIVLGGSIAYWSTTLVHWQVGYTSLMHLLPAYFGYALLVLAATLCYPYMCCPDAKHESLWRKHYDHVEGEDER